MMTLIDIGVILAAILAAWVVISLVRNPIATVMAPIGVVVVVVGLFTAPFPVSVIGGVMILALPIGLASDPRLGRDNPDKIW
jgi:hypothetical protein